MGLVGIGLVMALAGKGSGEKAGDGYPGVPLLKRASPKPGVPMRVEVELKTDEEDTLFLLFLAKSLPGDSSWFEGESGSSVSHPSSGKQLFRVTGLTTPLPEGTRGL
jgi:hypothetical protein